MKHWRQRVAQTGGVSVLVDAAPYVELLNQMHERMSWSAVGRLCGYSGHKHVQNIAAGKYARINPDLAKRIRAAATKVPGADDAVYVSAVGARRRVQALIAIGYSREEIMRQTGYSKHPLRALLNGQNEYVLASTHHAIEKAFNRLCMKPRAGKTPQEKSLIARSRNEAARMGWPPPLAWNDIDDPNEKPRGVRRDEQEEGT